MFWARGKFSVALWLLIAGILTVDGAIQRAAGVESGVDGRANRIQQLMTNRACRNCKLAGVDWSRMDLNGVDLQGADLSGGRFLLTSLVSANLRNARLCNASFGGADLENADLRGADLQGAVLVGAYTAGARFSAKDSAKNANDGKPGWPGRNPEIVYIKAKPKIVMIMRGTGKIIKKRIINADIYEKGNAQELLPALKKKLLKPAAADVAPNNEFTDTTESRAITVSSETSETAETAVSDMNRAESVQPVAPARKRLLEMSPLMLNEEKDSDL